MTVKNSIPLPRFSPVLLARYGKTPGYRALGDMVRDGRIRTKVINGRHYVLEEDVPVIAADLGLVPAHAA